MKPVQARAAADLIARVFREFVAPLFAAEGQREFLAYAGPARLAARLGRNHRILVAITGRRIVGVIEVRGRSHVSLLFVEGADQRRGIARGLLRAAFQDAGGARRRITVNASPNSVAAYERLGFRVQGPERAKKGVRFRPMVYRGAMPPPTGAASGGLTGALAMIGRLWHGWTTPGNADAYEQLLRSEILPGIHRVAGYRGVFLMRRDLGTEVEFVTLTLFESMDAVRAFAGEDHEAAVVPPPARRLLSRFDKRSIHYEVLAAPPGGFDA